MVTIGGCVRRGCKPVWWIVHEFNAPRSFLLRSLILIPVRYEWYIKCASNAHVWCKSISILKAQQDGPDEWNVRQELHLPKLNEYHGCMVDSILKSREGSVLKDSLKGMYSIPPGKSSTIKGKRKWARMLCCHDKRQRFMPLQITWEGLWTILRWLLLKMEMYVGYEIYLW